MPLHDVLIRTLKHARSSFLFGTLTLGLTLSVNASGPEPEKFSGIIALHNAVRAEHQQHPLTWSPALANYAQQWVNHLAKTENCGMMHRPNYNGASFQQKHGENLFWASPVQLSNGRNRKQSITNRDIMTAWVEEENYYDYRTNRCQPGEDCGHFTQVVWHESRQVGCAMAVCSDQSQIWACNYHPRGNYIGERPY